MHTGQSERPPASTSSAGMRRGRIEPELLVVGASTITLGLGLAQNYGHDTITLVALLISLPLVAVSPRARVLVLIFGGLLVFESSAVVSLLKSAYLGVASVALLAAITRLVYRPDRRTLGLLKPMVIGAAFFAGVVVVSLLVATAERTALSDWLRDAAPYFLFCTIPIFALDFGTSMSRRYLISVLIAAGVLAALSFFVEWAGNLRQYFHLPISHLLLPSPLLPAALLCFSSSRAIASRWKARIQWTALSGALVAVLALLTGTRALAAVLLIVPLIVLLASRDRIAIRIFRGLLLAGSVLAIGLVITWLVVHVTGSNPLLLPDRFATVQVPTGDLSYRLRVQEFAAAAAVFLSSPLLGAGPGHIFHWTPILGSAWNTFTLDTGMVVPAKFGLVGVTALIAIGVTLVSFLQKTALTIRTTASWAALVAFATVGAIWLVLGSPFEDKGFTFGMILILALVLADYKASVPALEVGAGHRSSSTTRVVTIWSTYGDYHVARVKALAEHGFEVVPFAHGDSDPTYPFFQTKPDSLVVTNRGPVDRVNPVLSLLRTLRLLRIHQPDIVLTIGYERSESLAACLYARTSREKGGRRPVAILMVENRADDHPRNYLVERVKSVYLRLFDGFLASGSDSRDYLEQLAVPRSRIELGYSCVDNERIATLAANHRLMSRDENQTTGYFLTVARLVAKKNIAGVLRAFQTCLQSVSGSMLPISLVVCGDGPERGAIEDLIGQLDLGSSVHLLGEVTGIEAITKQLAGCKALVLASTRDETWGLVVNEAMAAGCPVLVSKQCGCARDLVEVGINGFLFDGENPDELAQHMLRLLANNDLVEAMGERSKQIISGFSPARFAASASKLATSAGVSQPTGAVATNV